MRHISVVWPTAGVLFCRTLRRRAIHGMPRNIPHFLAVLEPGFRRGHIRYSNWWQRPVGIVTHQRMQVYLHVFVAQ